jgi:hypothetical protein
VRGGNRPRRFSALGGNEVHRPKHSSLCRFPLGHPVKHMAPLGRSIGSEEKQRPNTGQLGGNRLGRFSLMGGHEETGTKASGFFGKRSKAWKTTFLFRATAPNQPAQAQAASPAPELSSALLPSHRSPPSHSSLASLPRPGPAPTPAQPGGKP